MNTNPALTTLLEAEPLAATYALAAAELEHSTAALERDLAAVRDRYLPGIKDLSMRCAQAEADLHQWVAAHPDCFTSPRTHVLSGIQIGMQSRPGAVEWDDEQTVIANLKRIFRDDPEMLATLISTTEEIRKDGVRALPADKFARTGCRLEGAGDAVVVRRTAGEVDRIVNAAVSKLVKAMVEQGNGKAKKARK